MSQFLVGLKEKLHQLGKWSSHYDTQHCSLQGHSTLTPIYLYSHRMTFGVLWDWTLQSTRSQFLDPYKLIHMWMNLDIIKYKYSSPLLDVSYNTKERSLHQVLKYDALVAHDVTRFYIHHSLWTTHIAIFKDTFPWTSYRL